MDAQLALRTHQFHIHGFNLLWIETVFSIWRWESADAEDQLYALFYAILHKGFEHPWILVSEQAGVPGTNSPRTLRDDSIHSGVSLIYLHDH